MLIGDLVLTNTAIPSTDLEMGDLLRKKVRRLTDKLVIAWTGSLVVASTVIGSMYQKLPADDAVTKNWLEDTLTGYDLGCFGELSVHLIGWLIDDQEHCFRWNSDYPGEVFYGEPMVDGSGAPAFNNFFRQARIHTYPNPSVVELYRAAAECLRTVAHLMFKDIVPADWHDAQSFGYAYEILCWTDEGFQYLDNLLYLRLDVRLDNAGRFMGAELKWPIHKYLNIEEYAVIQKITFEGGRNVTKIDLVGPADFAMPVLPQQEVEMFLEKIIRATSLSLQTTTVRLLTLHHLYYLVRVK